MRKDELNSSERARSVLPTVRAKAGQLLSAAIVLGMSATTAFAQPNPGGGGGNGDGGQIFRGAARTIVDDIATGAFGGMATAITIALAIVAAVTGSYRGAWAVLFVSIGLFVLQPLCALLFPGTFQ